MVEELIITKMETNIQGSGETINDMDKVNTFGRMETDLKENG